MLDDEARDAIASLARRYALDERQEALLVTLTDCLADDPHAPTAVKSAQEVVDFHLADSLSALELEPFAQEGTPTMRIADIGAGAGLPGLVLAVALPRCNIRLVESQARKCAYIDGVISELALPNAASVSSRTEDWGDGRDAHDVVTARAVGPQSVVLEFGAPLLTVGGRLVDWRGRRDSADEEMALRAAAELGLERDEVVRVIPFAGALDRHLHLFRKTAPTPDRFPRRAGMARKRPLGSAKRGR